MAAEAKYHKQCSVRYFSGRIANENARGRPEDAEKQSAFDSLCAFLYENDECQYSLADLEERLNEEGKPAYSRKHLNKKLLAKFGECHHNRITWGKNGVVSFKDTAQKILHDKWYTDKAPNGRTEDQQIVKTAAAIVPELSLIHI